MKKSDQKRFVKDLTRAIRKTLINQIESGKIPPGWDGQELRVLIEKQAVNDASTSNLKKSPRSKRAREFRLRCFTHNL